MSAWRNGPATRADPRPAEPRDDPVIAPFRHPGRARRSPAPAIPGPSGRLASAAVPAGTARAAGAR